MGSQDSVVMFGLPGLNTGSGQGFIPPAQTEESAPMTTVGSAKFLPIIMIVLLVAGFLGLRWLMED